MKDEFDNECGFDFKNLLTNYKKCIENNSTIGGFYTQYGSQSIVSLDQYFYTFSRVLEDGSIIDASLNHSCNHNSIEYVSRTTSNKLDNYLDLPNDVIILKNSGGGDIINNHFHNFTTQTCVCACTYIEYLSFQQITNNFIVATADNVGIQHIEAALMNANCMLLNQDCLSLKLEYINRTVFIGIMRWNTINVVQDTIFNQDIISSNIKYILKSTFNSAISLSDIFYVSQCTIGGFFNSRILHMYTVTAPNSNFEDCNIQFIRNISVDSGISFIYNNFQNVIYCNFKLPETKKDHLISVRYFNISILLYSNITINNPDSNTTKAVMVSFYDIDSSISGESTNSYCNLTLEHNEQRCRIKVYKYNDEILFKYSNEPEPMFWEEYE